MTGDTRRRLQELGVALWVISCPVAWWLAFNLSPWFLAWGLFSGIVIPLVLAVHFGGNPYSPRHWQSHCRRHGYTYYSNMGDRCPYCEGSER